MSDGPAIEETFEEDYISPEDRRELKERLRDMKDPIRFVVASDLFFRFGTKKLKKGHMLFFNLSDDTWCSDLDRATCFKRREYAQAVANILDDDDDKSLITKITVKNSKRRVVKYRS